MIRLKKCLPKLPKLQHCWMQGRKASIPLSMILLVIFSLLLILSDCQISEQPSQKLIEKEEKLYQVFPSGYSYDIQMTNCSSSRSCTQCSFQFMCNKCSGSGKCCPKHCRFCMSSKNCTSCEEGFKSTPVYSAGWQICVYQNKDFINRDPLNTQKCAVGYYLQRNTNYCYPCLMPQCKHCSRYNDCYDCIEGYYISSTTHQCEKCYNPDCLKCSPTGSCENCFYGFTLENGNCHRIEEKTQLMVNDQINDQTQNQDQNSEEIVIDQPQAPECPSFDEVYFLGLTIGICGGACCIPLYQKLKQKCQNSIERLSQKFRNWFCPEDPQQEIELNEQIQKRDEQVQRKSSKWKKPNSGKNGK